MQAGDFALNDFATRVEPSMGQEGVTVSEGVARAKFDEIPVRGLFGLALDGLTGFFRLRSRLGGGFGRSACIRSLSRVLRGRTVRCQGERKSAQTRQDGAASLLHILHRCLRSTDGRV